MKNIISKEVTQTQYELLAQMRMHQDELVWQTPFLSLTGQAFLFTIAFGTGSVVGRVVASVLIIVVASASVQLLMKHRHLEVGYSRLLERIEAESGMQAIHQKPVHVAWLAQISSYQVWFVCLGVFCTAGIIALILALAAN